MRFLINLSKSNHMRLTAVVIIINFCLIGNASAQSIREDFVVETVSRYESETNYATTTFSYDEDHKLLTKNVIGKLTEAGQVIDVSYLDEFEYINGKVSKIKINDFTHFMFSHELHFFYDDENKLTRKETWMNDVIIDHVNYHYQDNRMVSTYKDNMEPFEFNTIYYDSLGNVVHQIQIYPETDFIGQPIPGQFITRELYYEYDSNPKPNFRLDYLLGYQPFPWLGYILDLEMISSHNNMTKAFSQERTFNYSYNEYGLPITLHDIFDPIGPIPAQLYSITYKQISSLSTEDKKIPEINIYPNPVTDLVYVECDDIQGTLWIFDMQGREVLTKDFHTKTAINTAHLSSGVYNIRLVSRDNTIIMSQKMLKN